MTGSLRAVNMNQMENYGFSILIQVCKTVLSVRQVGQIIF